MTNTIDNKQPRKPNAIERKELSQYIAQIYQFWDDPIENQEAATEIVDMAYIAVFDNCGIDLPGGATKIMLVVWDGVYSQYEAFRWENGKIEFIPQETTMPK